MLSVHDTFVTKPSPNYYQVAHYYLFHSGALISAILIQKPAWQYLLESKLSGGADHVLLKSFGSPYQMCLPSALQKTFVKEPLNFFFLFHIHQSCLPSSPPTHILILPPSPSPSIPKPFAWRNAQCNHIFVWFKLLLNIYRYLSPVKEQILMKSQEQKSIFSLSLIHSKSSHISLVDLWPGKLPSQ